MNDINVKIYAGVLGKILGVHMGRPVEGWTYEAIKERFGNCITTRTRLPAHR